jgi:hypothetical protein
MPDRGQCAREIDQVHHLAAQHISQAIRIVGQRKFRILGL